MAKLRPKPISFDLRHNSENNSLYFSCSLTCLPCKGLYLHLRMCSGRQYRELGTAAVPTLQARTQSPGEGPQLLSSEAGLAGRRELRLQLLLKLLDLSSSSGFTGAEKKACSKDTNPSIT